MTSARVQSLKLSDQVTRVLAGRIVNGEIGEAGLPPTEQDICAEFGVSKTTAREVIGALAARVTFGPSFKLQRQRGVWIRNAANRWCLATVHPSFVLRSRIGGGYDAAYRAFVSDLAMLSELPALPHASE